MILKRTFFLVLFAFVISSLTEVRAYDFMIDGICYNILSQGNLTCEVTSNPNTHEESVVIPEYVNFGKGKYKVVAIGDNAFNERSFSISRLKNISIPGTVERIGKSAFYCCGGLSSVNIPQSVKLIDNNAFAECLNILSIQIPNSVEKIGAFSFMNCYALKNITILPGKDPIDIEFRAFSGAGYGDLNLYIGRSINEEDEGILSISPIRIDINEGIDVGRFCESARIKDKLRVLNIGKNISGFPRNLTDFSKLVLLRVQDETPQECPILSDDQCSSIKLIVPEGAIDNYRKSKGWKNINDIEEYSSIKFPDVFLIGTMSNWFPSNEWKFTVYNKDATIYKFSTSVPQHILNSDEFIIATEDGTTIKYALENCNSRITIDEYTKLNKTGNGWPVQLDTERWSGICWLNIDKGIILFTCDSKLVPDFAIDGAEEIFEEKNLKEKVYYNLQGVKIRSESLTPGIYIIEDKKEKKKILVR